MSIFKSISSISSTKLSMKQSLTISKTSFNRINYFSNNDINSCGIGDSLDDEAQWAKWWMFWNKIKL